LFLNALKKFFFLISLTNKVKSDMTKLIKGDILLPNLLHSVNLIISQYNLWYWVKYSIPLLYISYGCNNPLDRISRDCNKLKNWFVLYTIFTFDKPSFNWSYNWNLFNSLQVVIYSFVIIKLVLPNTII